MTNKLYKYISNMKNFVLNNKIVFFTVFVVGLLTHYLIYTDNVLSPDSLSAGLIHISGNGEMSLGRWGIAIFDFIRHGVVNNLLILLSCFVAISLSVLCLIKLFKVNKSSVKILLSAFIVSSPVFGEIFMFIYTADSYAYAFLLSIMTVCCLKSANVFLKRIGTIMCVIFSLSIYQAFIGVTLGLCVIYAVFQLLEKNSAKKVILNLMEDFFWIFIGMIFYMLLTKIILWANGLNFTSRFGADNFGIISIIEGLISKCVIAYKTFFEFYFKDSIILNSLWNRDFLNFLIFLLIIIFGFVIVYKNAVYKKKMTLILLAFLLLIYPLTVNAIELIIVSNINLFMSSPLLLVYIVALICVEKITKKESLLKYVIFLVIIAIIYVNIYSVNASYQTRKQVFENYYATAIQVSSDIKETVGYSSSDRYLFGGQIKFSAFMAPYSNGGTALYYETWGDVGDIWQNFQFFRIYLGENYNMVSSEEANTILNSKEYQNMPAYPDEGYINKINGVNVIKLSK